MENQLDIRKLKLEAKSQGLSFSGNIGAEKLQQRLKDHYAGIPVAKEIKAPVEPVLTEYDIQEKKLKEATKLVRIIATPMDPAKSNGERQGEYVMVGNNVVGTIKKFIPYDQPVHIEQILLNALEEKKFQQRRGKGNKDYVEVKEFSIQILPDLTIKEVEELKKIQAIRKESANVG